MTLDSLKEYPRLKADEVYYEVEIQRLNNLKKEKISYYQPLKFNYVPGGNPSSPTENLALLSVDYVKKIDNQISQLDLKLKECQQRIAQIDSFIDSIPDGETRSMMRRHIKQRASFSQIANEFFVSRNYVSKRIKAVCN